MIFVTSDWHFGHNREFIWKPRGFSCLQDMNEAIVERHNSRVKPDDDVYVLGDLCLGNNEDGRYYISRMNGRLHVVYGNHDTAARRLMYSKMPNIVEAAPAIELKYNKYHFFLSHYPCFTGNLEMQSLKQGVLNLYGHTHQKTKFYEDRPYMYHVGVDSSGCFPLPLDTVIKDMENKVVECLSYC